MTPDPIIIVRSIIAVLKLPSNVSNLITTAKAIHDAMKNDARFAASLPTLALLLAAIENLYAMETGCKQQPPVNTIAERDAAKVIVINYLKTLRNDVQDVADADKPNAEAIVVAAAMFVKKTGGRGKQQNTVENDVQEGCVVLTAEGEGGHEWRMSKDNQTWTLIEYSGTTKTKVCGLTSGDIYYFQNRRVFTKGQKGEWSQSLKIRVK